jgi:tetratricopeptide (TPR) repeat protein/O-antigen ligase
MEKKYERILQIILISIIVFTPFPFGSVKPWAITLIELASLILGLFWFFKLLARGRIEFISTPLNLLIIFWLGFTLFQLFTSTSYFEATRTEFFKFLSYSTIILVFINNIHRKSQMEKIITSLIVVGFTISLLGIIQDLTWNGKLFWIFPLTHRVRVFGPYINKDHFAGYIVMLIPLAIGYLFSLRGGNRVSMKWFSVLAIMFMLAGLFLSQSRGGVISLFLSLVVMVLVLSRMESARIEKQLPFLFALVLFIALAWFFSGSFAQKMHLSNDPSWKARLWAWKGTIKIVKDFPLLGTGLGTFMHVFPKYRLPETKLFFTHAHNDFLELLSEVGVVGFVLVSIFWLLFLSKTLRLLFSRRDTWAIYLTTGGLSSLLAIFIFSFSDFNLHIPANAVLFSITIGIVATVVNLRPSLAETATFFEKISITLNQKVRMALYPLSIAGFIILSTFVTKPFLAERNLQLSQKTKSAKEKIEYLKKSISLQPKDGRYHYSLAQFYGEKGDWLLALQCFKQATVLNPNSSQYYEGLAWAYAHLGREKETIECLKKSIQLEPNNPYRHRNLALFYLYYQAKKGPPDRYLQNAIFEYKNTILLQPSFTQEALEKFSQFIKDYHELKAIIPDTPEAHFELSKYLKARNREESNLELQKAIEGWQSQLLTASNSNQVEIYKNIAGAYINSERYLLAITQYEKALTIAPRDAWTYYRLGTLYETMAERDKAIDSFRKAISIDPEHSWSYYRLAKIYESQGDSIKSLLMWNAILNIRNGDPDAERIARRELKKY